MWMEGFFRFSSEWSLLMLSWMWNLKVGKIHFVHFRLFPLPMCPHLQMINFLLVMCCCCCYDEVTLQVTEKVNDFPSRHAQRCLDKREKIENGILIVRFFPLCFCLFQSFMDVVSRLSCRSHRKTKKKRNIEMEKSYSQIFYVSICCCSCVCCSRLATWDEKYLHSYWLPPTELRYHAPNFDKLRLTVSCVLCACYAVEPKSGCGEFFIHVRNQHPKQHASAVRTQLVRPRRRP